MQWLIVALKEIKDNLRDKRAFFFAIVYGPIIMPLMIVGPMLLGAKTGFIDYDADTTVYVAGSEYAPNLIEYLKKHNLVAQAAPEDYRHKIREGELDAVLEVTPLYGEKMREGLPGPLYLYLNHSNKKSEKAGRHLKQVIHAYSGQLNYWRLRARGVDHQLTQVIQIVEEDLSSEGLSGMIFGFFMYFIIVFTMMTGGFYLAVDITAGERERNSLEPLLALPISRRTIVMGKYAAIFSFVFLSGLLSSISLYILFQFLPFDELSMFLNVDASALASAFLLAIPCSFLITSLLTATAAYTKSAKEAQTYISLLYLIPMVPMLIGQFMDIKNSFSTMLIPFYSQYTLIDKTVKNETLLPEHVVASVGGTLSFSVLLLLLAIWLYRQERILST
ncbi:ABC transporter permease [Teredinibacter haidensis]|uniref:ABC transporter permease n=1 Tax=Teredinibacter haidensis TaxID=2731755 RepID=UPI0009FA2406|nr:ABC transporter permease [Teredinibacter haidensis]